LFLICNFFIVLCCKQGIWLDFYLHINDFQEIAQINTYNCKEISVITENEIKNTCLSEQKIEKLKVFLSKHKINHVSIDKKTIDIVYSFDTLTFKSVAITNKKPLSGIFKIKSIHLLDNWYYYEIN